MVQHHAVPYAKLRTRSRGKDLLNIGVTALSMTTTHKPLVRATQLLHSSHTTPILSVATSPFKASATIFLLSRLRGENT